MRSVLLTTMKMTKKEKTPSSRVAFLGIGFQNHPWRKMSMEHSFGRWHLGWRNHLVAMQPERVVCGGKKKKKRKKAKANMRNWKLGESGRK
jgi:hypothetical protein